MNYQGAVQLGDLSDDVTYISLKRLVIRSTQRPNYVSVRTQCHFMSTYVETINFCCQN